MRGRRLHRSQMKMSDTDPVTVRAAVQEMDREFLTKCIWEHPAVAHAHAWISNQHTFHQLLGKYLSRYGGELNIRIREPNAGSAKWQKL